MRTDTLIDLLARGNEPVPVTSRLRPYAIVAALGFGISASLSITIWGAIPLVMFETTAPWIKIAYAGTLAGVAGVMTERLSRPGVPTTSNIQHLEGVLCVIACASLLEMVLINEEERLDALLGHSAILCPWIVLLLSLPVFFATTGLMREHAPTRLRTAGFAVGVFSGAIAALGYSLACTELSVTFVAVWYTAGIALSGLVGAMLGPRLLAW